MVDLIYIAEFEEQKVVFQYFNDCCVNTEQFLRFASFHPTYMFGTVWQRRTVLIFVCKQISKL